MPYQFCEINKKNQHEVFDFLKTHYNINKVTTLFTKYYDESYHPICLRYNDMIVGFVLVLIFDGVISNIPKKIGHATYLCIHTDFRKQGLIYKITNEINRYLDISDASIGYYQSVKSIGYSIPISNWIMKLQKSKNNISWNKLDTNEYKKLYEKYSKYPIRLQWEQFCTFYSHKDYILR